MKQGNQNVAFVVLVFATGLGGYLWGHNVGHRLATQAVLDAVQNAPALPSKEPADDPDSSYIKVLEEHNAELLDLVKHLRKDIEKLEAIIREMRRSAPKNASISRNPSHAQSLSTLKTNWQKGSR